MPFMPCNNLFRKDLHKHSSRQEGKSTKHKNIMNVVINDKQKVAVSDLFKNKTADV